MPRTLDSLMTSVDQEAQWKNADEARLQPQARLGVSTKYLFRFLPGAGVRSLTVKIPRVNDFVDERMQKAHDRSFERVVKREYGDDPLGELGFDLNSLWEKTSGWIEFQVIPGGPGRQTSCYYATDDDEIAAFLRYRMQVGGSFWGLLREEHPTERITVNGMEIPNTSEGWDAARIAAMQARQSLKE